MDFLVSRHFWQDLPHRGQYIGWSAVAAITLFIAALFVMFILLIPSWQHLLRAEHALQQLQINMPKHQGKFIDHSPQASLNTFYEFLPTESQAINSLSLIILAAAEYGIAPQKAEYATQHNQDATFSRYQVSLPVRGDYVAIRRFVTTVLNELPAASLSEISFRRNNIDSDEVEALLRFNLLYRKPQR